MLPRVFAVLACVLSSTAFAADDAIEIRLRYGDGHTRWSEEVTIVGGAQGATAEFVSGVLEEVPRSEPVLARGVLDAKAVARLWAALDGLKWPTIRSQQERMLHSRSGGILLRRGAVQNEFSSGECPCVVDNPKKRPRGCKCDAMDAMLAVREAALQLPDVTVAARVLAFPAANAKDPRVNGRCQEGSCEWDGGTARRCVRGATELEAWCPQRPWDSSGVRVKLEKPFEPERSLDAMPVAGFELQSGVRCSSLPPATYRQKPRPPNFGCSDGSGVNKVFLGKTRMVGKLELPDAGARWEPLTSVWSLPPEGVGAEYGPRPSDP